VGSMIQLVAQLCMKQSPPLAILSALVNTLTAAYSVIWGVIVFEVSPIARLLGLEDSASV
jgi:hypothetical protein